MSLSIAEATSIISTTFAAVAAGLSAFAIFRAQKLAREQQANAQKLAREQRANDSMKKYLELSIAYPKLSSETVDDQYDWFFSFLLLTAQDMLEAHKGDKGCELAIKNQLRLHRETLVAWRDDDKKNNTDFLGSYGEDVRAFVHEVLLEKVKA
jgi:hypothetical protein